MELRDNALTYTRFSPGHTQVKREQISPTAAQWREFRHALDDLAVWQWHTDYPSHDVAGGTQWDLEIAYADHALHAHGDNNYPDDKGQPNCNTEPSKAFRRYLAAVQKLLGGKVFE